MHKTLTALLVIFIISFVQPAFSQYYKLDCEVTNYGPNYTTGKGQRVAENFFQINQLISYIVNEVIIWNTEFLDGLVYPKTESIFPIHMKTPNITPFVLKYIKLPKNNFILDSLVIGRVASIGYLKVSLPDSSKVDCRINSDFQQFGV